MRVFVTGASGWIGSAVVAELIGSGHEVVGLHKAASASDGVIHLAFKHDIAFAGGFEAAAEADRSAIETFGEALAGSDRPLLIASGTLGARLAAGTATETDGHAADPALAAFGPGPQLRWANAEFTLALAKRGVRSVVVRLPPTNHGDGDNGFMASLVGIARDKGASGYIGDGANRWPAVHRLDSAHLFLLALEKAPAGSTLHAVADEGVPIRDVAEVIGQHLDVPLVSVPPQDARAHFSWLAHFIGLDSPASSALTREMLGWEPPQPGLIEDLDQGHYFRQP
jgi:nucleoside-diphosphate-sugar epimerase